jgi:hypothetical protein
MEFVLLKIEGGFVAKDKKPSNLEFSELKLHPCKTNKKKAQIMANNKTGAFLGNLSARKIASSFAFVRWVLKNKSKPRGTVKSRSQLTATPFSSSRGKRGLSVNNNEILCAASGSNANKTMKASRIRFQNEYGTGFFCPESGGGLDAIMSKHP